MKKMIVGLAILGSVFVFGTALADDVEGAITSIDPKNASFVVQGITFYTNAQTDYDDGLKNFADLKIGDKVEVDFAVRDGRHVATEIERTEQ
ncbi:MAG: DUF1344 domain-containing protein [Desulfobulbaceae bacterium]|nr:DUF1344 domain-containing protein [Desulfobulbaceae bacterium]